MAQRRILLPVLALLAATASLWSCAPALTGAFVTSGLRGTARPQWAAGRSPRVALAASDVDKDEVDTVEVSGFSGFVVGVALLPHVAYALTTVFDVISRGESFGLGPYGLQLISCTVTVGLVLWSLGSFLQRGKGLPAGPLGLLGLAEGLSYLAALGLVLAAVSTSVRSGGVTTPQISAPSMPSVSMPKAPEFKVPDLNVPNVNLKMPDLKVKIPDFKMPDVKMPDVKMPEVKLPELKKEEKKAPEAPKPALADAPPAPAKPAPPPPKPTPPAKTEEAKPPSAPKTEKPVDYGDLFD